MAKRDTANFIFEEQDNHRKVKDKLIIFSHSIKKLDEKNLTSRKAKREELSTNPKLFEIYKNRLKIHSKSFEETNEEEKIKLLRYLVARNLRLAKVHETFLNLLYTVLTRKPIDTNKLGDRKNSSLKQSSNCGVSGVIFCQLLQELLDMNWKIYAIAGHHSYILTENGYYVDFSEKLILHYNEYSSWVFDKKEEYLKYVKDTFWNMVLF